jgi:hypothetical protein
MIGAIRLVGLDIDILDASSSVSSADLEESSQDATVRRMGFYAVAFCGWALWFGAGAGALVAMGTGESLVAVVVAFVMTSYAFFLLWLLHGTSGAPLSSKGGAEVLAWRPSRLFSLILVLFSLLLTPNVGILLVSSEPEVAAIWHRALDVDADEQIERDERSLQESLVAARNEEKLAATLPPALRPAALERARGQREELEARMREEQAWAQAFRKKMHEGGALMARVDAVLSVRRTHFVLSFVFAFSFAILPFFMRHKSHRDDLRRYGYERWVRERDVVLEAYRRHVPELLEAYRVAGESFVDSEWPVLPAERRREILAAWSIDETRLQYFEYVDPPFCETRKIFGRYVGELGRDAL